MSNGNLIAPAPDYDPNEFAPLALLEQGDVDVWVRRRGAILIEKSRETAKDCEASKLASAITVGASVVMSSNPVAWIPLTIGAAGYIYTIFQEFQDIGSIRLIPMYRGKLGDILRVMEGGQSTQRHPLEDQIEYLSEAEKDEVLLINYRFGEIAGILNSAPPKVRFDLYRHLCGQFHARRDLITGDEVKHYINAAVSQARRTAIVSDTLPSSLPPAEQQKMTPASFENGAARTQLQSSTNIVHPVQPVSDRTGAPTSSKLEPVDIALEMAKVPKSTIIAASPRVGKGVVVSMAIAHLRQLHPDLEIWLIDPKDEPTERHYWAGIDPDKRCHFDLRDFDVDVEGAIEAFSDLLSRFNRSQSHRKLLIIDEFVTLNQKCAGPFMNQLKDFIVGICSSGEVNPDMGIGRFVWAVTQSPYVSDLGFKTKAALATFQRVFLLSKASINLYQLAVSASFVPAGFEQKLNRLLEVTGRIFYYSRTDSWHPIPIYNLPKSSTDSGLREKLEGLLPATSQLPGSHPEPPGSSGSSSPHPEVPESASEEGLPASDDWRKYFPEAPAAVEEALFVAYQQALKVEGGKKKFISEILKAGTGGRKYQAASAYVDYLCKKFGKQGDN